MSGSVVGLPGREGVVLQDVVVDVEDGAVDAIVDSSVVEGGKVDVVGLGKVTIQYFAKTVQNREQDIKDTSGGGIIL